MSDKTATVHWEGRGKQGVGRISTQTEALKSYPYGYASRFEDDKRGTNPEELLAAAHAACFTMAFSFGCDAAGFSTTAIDTAEASPLSTSASGSRPAYRGSTKPLFKKSPPRRNRTAPCPRRWPAFRTLR
jgi:osmotically inducible protein OsmC